VPRPLPAPFRSLSLLLPSLVACAHAASPQPSPRALDLTPAAVVAVEPELRIASVGPDGARAAPDVCPSARCGLAGRPTQVTLDARRDEALAVFERYVRAVSARSAGDVRALLDDTVASARDGAALSREAVVAQHTRLFDLMDARGFEATDVRVLSHAECRRQGRPVATGPGDWYLEWRTASFRAMPAPLAVAPPTQMIVRWRDGVGRVAALNHEFLSRRAL
jgi:hypothetical protein